MASTTAVHCPGCGYENNPQYKFCGMCGSALREENLSSSGRARPQPAPLSVGGYSILGLEPEPPQPADLAFDAEESSSPPAPPMPSLRPPVAQPATRIQSDSQQNELLNRNLDYLFEGDKKKRSPHWRMYVALALLVIAALTLVWQWQRNGYPWDDLSPLTSGQTFGTTPVRAAQPPAVMTAATDTKPPAGLPAPPKVTENKPPPAAIVQPTIDQMRSVPPPQPASGQADEEEPATAETADSSPQDENAAVGAHLQQTASASLSQTTTMASDEAASPAGAAHLLAEGTQYLLGNGVEQNCEMAQKDLLAASHSSSDAQAMLGTMYASGHCVGRDLPAAYRWYARALHSRPGNARLQGDLTVLWNQMTAAERAAATRGQQ